LTMRPSAGDSTNRSPSGACRGGSRKNCNTNAAMIQNVTDAAKPNITQTAKANARLAPMKGQPSRARMGCGQGVNGQFFDWSTSLFLAIHGIIARS